MVADPGPAAPEGVPASSPLGDERDREPTSPEELARRLRWWIEAQRASGWDPDVSVSAEPGVSPAPAPRAPAPAPAPRAPAPRAPAPRAPAPAPPVDLVLRRKRDEALEPIRREVAACQGCDLCRGRTRTVFGTGDPAARLMFVGEGPGYEEDRRGEPFVGRAGHLLDDIIRAMRLRRQDVYIANVVKCRPPNNRNPDAMEVARCLSYLQRQIAIVRPLVVCALGAVAARALLGKRGGSLGSLRGRFHTVGGVPVRVTYHPAYLLRNPADKRKTWEDVQAIMARLGL